MKIDFHYYGTYVAARLAGYNFTEAQTIAHASQYVDESSNSMIKDLSGFNKKIFTPIPTTQTYTEALHYDGLGWSGTQLLETYKVWVSFHFLPGNYGRPDTHPYKGPMSGSSPLISWRYNKESEKNFELLCLPDSLLVQEMINDLTMNHNTNLHFIGLRMHVLADTWSHMYFAGMPAWFMNDAIKMKTTVGVAIKGITVDVEIFDDADKKRQYEWLLEGNEATNDINRIGQYSPDNPYYNSYMYLGHGRMGRVPDYPFLKYEYQPRWSDTRIEKDNRDFFLNAFKQLVKAMQCIRNKVDFATKSYAPLDRQWEDIIKAVLHTEQGDQCETWIANIPKIIVNGSPLEIPEKHEKTRWLTEFKEAGESGSETDYYKFNLAAVQHVEMVTKHLESHDHFILSGDDGKNSITVNLRTEEGEYIGASSKGETRAHDFAKMSTEPIPLKIIKIDSSQLRSGDIVQIKTSESKTGENSYLGAWKTNHALYYFLKDRDMFKQRWEIVKVDLSKDDVIRHGERIYIKNLHFTSNPYMSSYIYFNIFNIESWFKRKKYLTTQHDQVEWILEEAK